MSNSEPEPANRAQRVLAFMVAALVVLSLACFAASLIGRATESIGTEPSGIWITVILLPGLALPVALLLTVALFVVTTIRRRNANRG